MICELQSGANLDLADQAIHLQSIVGTAPRHPLVGGKAGAPWASD